MGKVNTVYKLPFEHTHKKDHGTLHRQLSKSLQTIFSPHTLLLARLLVHSMFLRHQSDLQSLLLLLLVLVVVMVVMAVSFVFQSMSFVCVLSFLYHSCTQEKKTLTFRVCLHVCPLFLVITASTHNTHIYECFARAFATFISCMPMSFIAFSSIFRRHVRNNVESGVSSCWTNSATCSNTSSISSHSSTTIQPIK